MWVITQIDYDAEQARALARRALAFFFSTPGYETAAAGETWLDAPERIRRRFAETRADWDAVSAEVPDEMLAAMTLCGTPADVRAQLPGVEARLRMSGSTRSSSNPAWSSASRSSSNTVVVVAAAATLRIVLSVAGLRSPLCRPRS